MPPLGRRAYVRVAFCEVEALTLAERVAFVRWAAAPRSVGELGSQDDAHEEDVLLARSEDGPVFDAQWRVSAPRARPRCAAAAFAGEEREAVSIASFAPRGRAVLVTGASGGLGKALVAWLKKEVGVAPSQLVLLGRSACCSGDGERTAVVRDLSLEQLRDCDALRNEQLPGGRVGCIFHLAGALQDGTLGSLDKAQFNAVIAPKAAAVVALRALACERKWRTKCLVAYSSTTSLYGFGGQTNYAAANALLDALADWGEDDADEEDSAREPPPPVLSVQWGPWLEAGMAAAGTKAHDLALRTGDASLPTRDALKALATALAANPRVHTRVSTRIPTLCGQSFLVGFFSSHNGFEKGGS